MIIVKGFGIVDNLETHCRAGGKGLIAPGALNV